MIYTKNFLKDITSHLFISVSDEEERKIINNNFLNNLLKLILYSIFAISMKFILSVYSVFKIFNGKNIHNLYFVITLLQIVFFVFFIAISIRFYNNKKLNLQKQKILVYSFLTIYLAFEVYFLANDFIYNGTLVGFYFDLLLLSIIPLFNKKITYLYIVGYTIFSFIVITISQRHMPLPNFFSPNNASAMLAFIGFYMIAGYSRKIYITTLYLQGESKRLVNLHESDNLLIYNLNQQLDVLTTTDKLTGIPNRRAFETHVNRIWFQCLEEKKLVTIFMIDLDDFKMYNDTFGHQNGDKVLKIVAETMYNAIKRKDDILARYDGEKFIALLPYTRKLNIVSLASKLIEEVNKLELSVPPTCPREYLSVSIGIASCIPSTELQHDDLIDLAEKALSKAKNSGKNCYLIYDKNDEN